MSINKKNISESDDNGYIDKSIKSSTSLMTEQKKKMFKNELMDLFRSYGFIEEDKDYEIRIKTTSGNIAWINIKGVETIK